MPSSDVLELDAVLYILELMKSLLSISCMTELHYLAKFNGQLVTIRDIDLKTDFNSKKPPSSHVGIKMFQNCYVPPCLFCLLRCVNRGQDINKVNFI